MGPTTLSMDYIFMLSNHIQKSVLKPSECFRWLKHNHQNQIASIKAVEWTSNSERNCKMKANLSSTLIKAFLKYMPKIIYIKTINIKNSFMNEKLLKKFDITE